MEEHMSALERIASKPSRVATAFLAGFLGVKTLKTILHIPEKHVQAAEVNPNGYTVPDLREARQYSNKEYDNHGDTIRVIKYLTKNGGRVGVVMYKDKIIGYGIDHDRKQPPDFQIADTDGDGIFETKYAPDEEFYVPSWAKQ